MKETIRKFVPKFILALHWKYFKSRLGQFKGKETEDVFTTIYQKQYWGNKESVSGDGSTKEETQNIANHLPHLFKEYGIQSMLDIPCGDYYWMQHVTKDGVAYTGGDIVADLVESNNRKFEKQGVTFKHLDLTKSDLPKVDLVFTRDCLVHLSEDKVFAAINNIKRSGSKYFMTTTFTTRTANKDIITGDWRAVNLQIAPYNFPKPIVTIADTKISNDNDFSDKVMALYEVASLPTL